MQCPFLPSYTNCLFWLQIFVFLARYSKGVEEYPISPPSTPPPTHRSTNCKWYLVFHDFIAIIEHPITNTKPTLWYTWPDASKESLCNRDKRFQKQLPSDILPYILAYNLLIHFSMRPCATWFSRNNWVIVAHLQGTTTGGNDTFQNNPLHTGNHLLCNFLYSQSSQNEWVWKDSCLCSGVTNTTLLFSCSLTHT